MRKLIGILLLAIVLFGAVACSRTEVVDLADRVLRLDESNLGYPSVYTVSWRGRGFLMSSFIFDTLTWKDEDGLTPHLAKSWSVSEDNLTWVFELVDNARFTDGEQLTSEDVKFSYEYLKRYPHPWVSVEMVEAVEVIDTFKVQITLSDVYAPFLTEVAGNVPIMPKHIWEDVTDPQRFNTPEAVIGSGPYLLEEYDATAGSYVYVANTDYFLGEPQVGRLIFSNVSDAAAALKNGDLDAAQRFPYGRAAELEQGGQFKVLQGPGFWVYRMYFNFDLPEFNDVAVRQAMYYAIDRQELVDKARNGGAIPGNPGHIHPDSEWYSGDVKQYGFDVEAAKSLLDDAGIVDSNGDGIRQYNGKAMRYELLIASDRVGEAELVKGFLADIGIEVDIKTADQRTVDSLINEGNFQLAMNGHGAMGGDPVLLASFAGRASQGPQVTAQGGQQWSNDEFDELFIAQLRELDHVKRHALVSDMQKIIAEELPTLSFYYTINTFAYDPAKLNGWFYTKDGVSRGVPTLQNKLVYIRGTWGR